MAFYKPLLFYLIAIVSGPIIVPPVIRPAGPGIFHVFSYNAELLSSQELV